MNQVNQTSFILNRIGGVLFVLFIIFVRIILYFAFRFNKYERIVNIIKWMNRESRSICVNCDQFQREETRPTFDSIEFYFKTYFSLSLVCFFLCFKSLYYLLLCCHSVHTCTTHNAMMVCDDETVNCVIKLCCCSIRI